MAGLSVSQPEPGWRQPARQCGLLTAAAPPAPRPSRRFREIHARRGRAAPADPNRPAARQFETIPPYLDGNGRIGRLLFTLLLKHWGLQERPLLYLSLFFKRNPAEYDRCLDAVRAEGDWEGWLDYFLEGVAIISEEAIASVRGLFAIASADRNRVLANKSATVPALRLLELLPRHPIVTVATTMNLVDVSKPTATTRAIGNYGPKARPFFRIKGLPRSVKGRNQSGREGTMMLTTRHLEVFGTVNLSP